MEIATKPPRLKETQIYDIQSIIFILSSCLGALVAEKTLFGVDSTLHFKLILIPSNAAQKRKAGASHNGQGKRGPLFLPIFHPLRSVSCSKKISYTNLMPDILAGKRTTVN